MIIFINYLYMYIDFTCTGVERLAGMSLTDPLRIDVSNAEEEDLSNNYESSKTQKNENFVVPEKLRQSFVITPCKLRLVTLTAFILLKMKVGFIPICITGTCKSGQWANYHFEQISYKTYHIEQLSFTGYMYNIQYYMVYYFFYEKITNNEKVMHTK